MGSVTTPYPVRWIAIKLLERDPEVARIVGSQDPSIIAAARETLRRDRDAARGTGLCRDERGEVPGSRPDSSSR